MSTVTAAPAFPPRWEAAAEEHSLALTAYLDSAGGLDDQAWQRPWAAGKWTPAQITEHVTMVYEVLQQELRGGEPMRPKLSPWRQKITRWILLPHILFHRKFPLRVPAPREIRPGEPRAGQREALRRLEVQAIAFEDELSRAFRCGSGTLTHPYFGCVDPVRGLRFVAVHLEHHRRQLEKAAR
jgi:hypothetical protein